jgi:hypothetical protein
MRLGVSGRNIAIKSRMMKMRGINVIEYKWIEKGVIWHRHKKNLCS